MRFRGYSLLTLLLLGSGSIFGGCNNMRGGGRCNNRGWGYNNRGWGGEWMGRRGLVVIRLFHDGHFLQS